MSKVRGFEIVKEYARTAFDVFTDEKKRKHSFPKEITLPTRSDPRSAGYDFYVPKEVTILPGKTEVIWTDVKAYMQPDEVLKIYIRSSHGIKNGLALANQVGIIDSSYYENQSNDGNIGIAIWNKSGVAVTLKEGERIAQGVFEKYLITDQDITTSEERKGGLGSSGK